MRSIRIKIWLVIVLLMAAMAVSTVIYSRGGFAIDNNADAKTKVADNNKYIDTTSYSGADGNAVFKANCATCHNIEKEATGPALMGVAKREPFKGFIKLLLLNPEKALTSSYYGEALRSRYTVHHTSYKNILSEKEINNVVFMIEHFGEDPVKTY